MKPAIVYVILTLSLFANGFLMGSLLHQREKALETQALSSSPAVDLSLDVEQIEILERVRQFADVRNQRRKAQARLIDKALWQALLSERPNMDDINRQLEELAALNAQYRVRLSGQMLVLFEALSAEQRRVLRERGADEGYFEFLGITWP